MNRAFNKTLTIFFCVAAILLVPLLFMCGCEKRTVVSEGPQVIPVKVVPATYTTLYRMLEYVGNIKAQDEATVYPKVSGKIIEKVKEDGSPINKGEAIAFIDRDEVGLKFERAPVESPISGVVGRIYVDIGSNVTAQTPVALVINMDNAKINLDIPEIYLPKVAIGQQAKIALDAYRGEEFIGTVTKISPVLDLETRSAPVEITVGNRDHRLKSGMFAKVKLIIEERKDVISVLKEAVLGKYPNNYVFVVENNKAVIRNVVLGITQDAHLEVKEGLKEGDLVVIFGQQRLYEDAPVKIEE